MAVILRSNFNPGTLVAAQDVSSVSGSPTIDTTIARAPAPKSLKITGLVSGTIKHVTYEFVTSSNAVHRFFRKYFYVVTRPSAANTVFLVGFGSSPSANQTAYLKHNADGSWGLWNHASGSPVQIGSNSPVQALNTWDYVEFEIDPTPASGSRVLRARFHGTEFAAATNLTDTLSSRSVSVGGNLLSEAQTQGEWYVSDVAANDASGTYQTSYPGACAATLTSFPNGAGSSAQFARAGVDSGANWDQVDGSYDTADYNQSGTLNDTDLFNVTDTPPEVLSDATFGPLCVSYYRSGSSAADDNPTLRAKLVVNGVTTNSAGDKPSSTSWLRQRSVLPLPLVAADGTGLTKAMVDAAQIGYDVSVGAASTQLSRVSNVWLVYEVASLGTGAVAADDNQLLLGVS
jgi:hypothetical protein